MKYSLTPAWVHKISAFATLVVASVAGWTWTSVIDAHTAGMIVSVLAGLKLVLEFVTKNTPET